MSKPIAAAAPVRVLYWFRTDLRIHSSPALRAALDLNPEVIYPIWTWDPQYILGHKVGVNRFKFLLDSLQDLSASISACNPNSKLHVVRGAPQFVIPYLFKEWGISHLVYEKDTAGYAAVRDHQINALASQAGIKVLSVLGHTLYDPEAVLKSNGGRAPMSLASWHAAVKKLLPPERPLPAPEMLPPAGNTAFSRSLQEKDSVISLVDVNSDYRIGKVTCFDTFAGPLGDFSVPTLDEMGLGNATTSISGGESEALRRLKEYCSDHQRVAYFSKPKTSPAEFNPPNTTLLSPYLKFGCLGVHEFYWRVKDILTEWDASFHKGKAQATREPENIEGQLFFREMYYAAECAQGFQFGQMHGNSNCRFIDWHLQNRYSQDGIKLVPRPLGDPAIEERLLAWKEGRTGFPWIDAIMRQLRQEGWIHHLARHSVACFLTRGQCYISWERGAEVFDEYLLDWDPCANPGNWMWVSASAFYNTYYRVYGTKSFPTKYDKTGKLVRKFCPELAKFPEKYIYCPHLAPIAVQEKAGCIIGKDYPEPMLDEVLEKQRCMIRMKTAYSLGLYGADKEVMSGAADKKLKNMYKETIIGIDSSLTVGEGDRKRKNTGGGGGDKGKAGGSKRQRGGAGSLDGYITKKKGK